MLKQFNQFCDKIITESSISKILYYIENFECATISASRGNIVNVTDKTFIPDWRDLDDDKTNRKLTKKENKERNSQLKAALLKLGYGVTALDGKYAENGQEFPRKRNKLFCS
jgi:hypothetical protein